MSESLDVPKTQLVSHDSFPIRIEIHARSSHGSSDGHGLPVVGSPMLAAWAMLAHSWDRTKTDFNGGTPMEDEHFDPENTPRKEFRKII